MILNVRMVYHVGAKQLDLSYEVNDFKNLCFAWDKYEKELQDSCALSIQHVRKYVSDPSTWLGVVQTDM